MLVTLTTWNALHTFDFANTYTTHNSLFSINNRIVQQRMRNILHA